MRLVSPRRLATFVLGAWLCGMGLELSKNTVKAYKHTVEWSTLLADCNASSDKRDRLPYLCADATAHLVHGRPVFFFEYLQTHVNWCFTVSCTATLHGLFADFWSTVKTLLFGALAPVVWNVVVPHLYKMRVRRSAPRVLPPLSAPQLLLPPPPLSALSAPPSLSIHPVYDEATDSD